LASLLLGISTKKASSLVALSTACPLMEPWWWVQMWQSVAWSWVLMELMLVQLTERALLEEEDCQMMDKTLHVRALSSPVDNCNA
jgi:hypothetical protein